ncbi:MAG: DNA mismatch repair protein MutS [Candidatus Thermoplasmatota archaeon]|nr:DNA mismatch repair protein MutS [Candidatus Thermoplasmatota archaeon]
MADPLFDIASQPIFRKGRVHVKEMKFNMFWKKTNKQKLIDLWGKAKEHCFDFDRIGYYHRQRDKNSAFQVISEQIIKDIDFYRLFTFVDRTHSSIGQQFLYSKLLTMGKMFEFDEQETLCSLFHKDLNKRLKTQILLSQLNQDEAYYVSSLFLEEFIKQPKYFPFLVAMSLLGFASIISVFFFSSLWILLVGVFSLNMFLHYLNKKHTYMYSDSIPQLCILINCVKGLLALELPVFSSKETNRAVGSLDVLKNKLQIFNFEANRQIDAMVKGMFAEFMYVVFEYLKIQLLLEPLLVFSTLKQLEKKKEDIKKLYEFIGTIDCAMSISSLRYGLKKFCIPKISNEIKTFVCKDIYHPLVKDCIQNSITLDNKSILLTGSNMSGKTTFIRSIAINALFAQTINTCFAAGMCLPPMRIYSAIRISDDVFSGKSYYFEEVQTINTLIKESHANIKSLFLLDEIFKGTNTIERIAAGKAVLSHLCKNENIVFVSTHDIELTDLLKNEYELFHFTEDVRDNTVHFDYKLKEGKLKTRNAIRILEINGYPKDIIAEAKALSDKAIQINMGNTDR